MISRSLSDIAIASLLAILTTLTTSAFASGWKPSGKPASSVTPTAFQEPVAAPEFVLDASDAAPPFLPPIPESESVNKADTSRREESDVEPSVPLEVPDFEPGETVSGAESKVVAESSDKASVERENADSKVSGESKLKLSDAAEDSEELVKPADWLGRWNMSSMDWVLRNGSDGIGFFSLTGDAPAWEFDLNSDKEGLEVDFGSGIHFVDGPGHAGSDLPPRLFDIFWNTRFKAETDYGFGIDANFKMGLFTDFEDSVREGWRFPGRVLAYADLWNSSNEVGRFVAGFEYLDLEQTEILPAGGVIFEPNPDTRIDLYFPRPQIRFRVDQEESGDQWLYFRGEYHGSAWAIERDSGNADVVSLTEYRASIGLESIPSDKEESSSFLEVGFLFNRDLEYRSGIGNFQPGDTIVIRLGSRY
tara:strand:+ start:40503 stop:41759 length:1257 start_codon:yes stop_codon:yes gene_type:complete